MQGRDQEHDQEYYTEHYLKSSRVSTALGMKDMSLGSIKLSSIEPFYLHPLLKDVRIMKARSWISRGLGVMVVF